MDRSTLEGLQLISLLRGNIVTMVRNPSKRLEYSIPEPVKCGGNVTQPTNIESKAVDAPCIFWVQVRHGITYTHTCIGRPR